MADAQYYEVIDTKNDAAFTGLLASDVCKGLTGLTYGGASIALYDARPADVREANEHWIVLDGSAAGAYDRTETNDVVFGGAAAGQTIPLEWRQVGWDDIAQYIAANTGANAADAVFAYLSQYGYQTTNVTAAADGTFAFFGQTAQTPAAGGGAYALESLCAVTRRDGGGAALRDDFGELIQYNLTLWSIVFIPAEQSGVSVTPETGAYDGSTGYGLTVGGAAPGAQIRYTYTDDDGVLREDQTVSPTFKTLGDHAVTVTVQRSDTVSIDAAQTMRRYADYVETVAVSVTAPADAPLVTGYTGLFDGRAHAAQAANVLAGDTAAYWTDRSAAKTAVMPEFVQVGAYTVFYSITRGAMTFTGSAVVTIIEGPSAADVTVDYDGRDHALTVTNVPDGGSMAYRLAGEGEDAWASSLARTDAGVYSIEYKLAGQSVCGTATLTIRKAYQTGVTAEPVRAYVGTGSYGARVTATAADAVIRYRDASGAYTLASSPVFAEVGAYTVDYRVTQGENYEALYGKATVSILALNEIANIAAENATVDYDGGAHGIVVSGTLVGDTVTYWQDGGAESATNPRFSMPGTYRVYYRVARAGNYGDVVGSALLTINELASDALQLEEYSGVFDGAYHGVTVAGKEGLQLTYSADGGKTWSETNPQFRDVTDTVVHVRALDPSGAVMALRNARVTISPAPLIWDISALEVQLVAHDDGTIEPRVTGGLRVQGLAEGDQGQFHAGAYSLQLGRDTDPYAVGIFYSAASVGRNYTLPRNSRFYYSVWPTQVVQPTPGMPGEGGGAQGPESGGDAKTYPWLTVSDEEGNVLPYQLLLSKQDGTALIRAYPDRDANGNALLDAAGKPVFGVRQMRLTYKGLREMLQENVHTLGFMAGDALLWLPIGELCAAMEQNADGGAGELAAAYLIVEIEPVVYDAATMPDAWAAGKRIFRIRVYMVIGDRKIDVTDSIAAVTVSFLLAGPETVAYWKEATGTWEKADAADGGADAWTDGKRSTVRFTPSGVFALLEEPDPV